MQFILRCLPTKIKDEHIDKERLPDFLSLEELREYIIQDLIKNRATKKAKVYELQSNSDKKTIFKVGSPIKCSKCGETKIYNQENFYFFRSKPKRVCKECNKAESKMYRLAKKGGK